MSLLEVYKERNKDKEWFNDHFSLAEGAHGRLFEYTSTNFRKQDSFTTQFSSFLEVENISREDWPKHPKHGQEMHKQMVINMLQSKLFKKDIDELYSRTAKGLLYSSFINLEISNDEKWFINYLFLLNGYYLNRKNYIIHRIKDDVLGYLLSTEGVTLNLLVKSAKALLASEDDFSALVRKDFLYIHSFYNDSEFLTTYLRSPAEEKEELAQYIENNLKLKSGSLDCCISRKFKSTNFSKPSLFDETKVFLLTILFTQARDINASNIYQKFVEFFSDNIASVTKKTILDYLFQNKDVFDSIFEDVLELKNVNSDVLEDDMTETVQLSQIDTEDVPEDYIDETSEVGRQRIKAVFALKKKQARLLSNYTCALESINNCKPVYFTAKVNNKNYLELHHLIPQEFRNDFSYSIEVLANYVTLCPRCHRQIHLAVDRERKHLINSLYDNRKDRLETVGLKLDLHGIYQYYKIDS